MKVKKILKLCFYIFIYFFRWLRCFHKFGHVGLNTKIGKLLNVFNGKHVMIGKNCTIMPGMRIECIENWDNQIFHPSISIGDNVYFSQMTHIVAAEKIIIEDNVGIGPFVMINSASHGFWRMNEPIRTQILDSKPIIIKKDTLIGAGVCIMPGVTIGEHCVIGANSVITSNIADYTIVASALPRKVKMPIAKKKN